MAGSVKNRRGKRAAGGAKPRGARSGAEVAAGVLCALLSLWLLFSTLTLKPFRWGTLVEELLVAVCAVCALRLFCFAKPTRTAAFALWVLLPAGVVLYSLFRPAGGTAGVMFSAALGLAAACALTWTLGSRADALMLCALLLAALLPPLLLNQRTLAFALLTALLTAGAASAAGAVKRRSVPLALLSALCFALGGALHLYAGLCALGAAAGLLLASPRARNGGWALAAVLTAALPFCLRLLAARHPQLTAALGSVDGPASPAWLAAYAPHALRALALGLLPFAPRLLRGLDRAAIPAVLTLSAGALTRLIPGLDLPDIWVGAPMLAALAGIGISSFS